MQHAGTGSTPLPAPRARPRAGLGGLLAAAVASAIALAILISLGMWQLERKAWKEGLLAQIQARAYGEPGEIAPPATWGSWRAEADEFRRVRVTGTFRHDLETLVHGLMPASRGAPAQGFYVFTPLERSDGTTLIVNRGFVPTELKETEKRAEAQVPGEVALTGLVRAPEARPQFVPPNDPARGTWFVRDVAEIARARSLERVAPFYVDADATPNPGGWPRGGQANLTLSNNHLQYAFTWFGIAGTLVGVFGVFAWRRLRGRAEDVSPAAESG
jgi:surfeit locus 1 family protein